MVKSNLSRLLLTTLSLLLVWSSAGGQIVSANSEGAYRATGVPFLVNNETDLCRAQVTGLGAHIPSGFTVGSNILDKVQENLYAYQAAEEATGVPAMFIASLHFRETGLSLNWPSNRQGLYQFFAEEGSFPGSGTASRQEFIDQSVKAGEFVLGKISPTLPRLAAAGIDISVVADDPQLVASAFSNSAFIKAIFMSFNGFAAAYGRQANDLGFGNEIWEGSPYVMNLWDLPRNGSRASNPNAWGQIKRDLGPVEYPANDQPGAYVIYISFGGDASGSSHCGSSGTGQAVVDIAIAQYRLVNGEKEYNQYTSAYSDGEQQAWCSNFVSWIHREAGSPFTGNSSAGVLDNWRVPAVVSLQAWFQEKGQYFDLQEDPDFRPQPGDVAFYLGAQTPDADSTSHTNIVISVSGDKMTTIGGNESDTVKQSVRDVQFGAQSLVGFGRIR